MRRACPVVMALVLLVALLPGAVAAAEVSDDFQYLPPDSNQILVLRVGQMVTSDTFKKLCKEVPGFNRDVVLDFKPFFGFDLEAVERMVGGNNANSQPIVVFRLTRAINAAEMKKEIRDMRVSAPRFVGDPTEYREVKVGRLTIHEPTREHGTAFCLLDEKTVVFGATKDLKATLERNRKAEFSAEMRAALKETDPAATISIAWDLKSLMAGEKKVEVPVPGVELKAILASSGSLALSVKLDRDMVVRFAAVANDQEAAQKLKIQFDTQLRAVGEVLPKVPTDPPKEFVELPRKINTGTKGNVAEATLSVSGPVVVKIVKWMDDVRRQPRFGHAPAAPIALTMAQRANGRLRDR
jgi:hypothetical protein